MVIDVRFNIQVYNQMLNMRFKVQCKFNSGLSQYLNELKNLCPKSQVQKLFDPQFDEGEKFN